MKKGRILFIFALALMLALCVVLAACAKDSYTVSYYSEGNLISSQKVSDGNSVIEAAAPSRDGYRFDYWYEEGYEDRPFDFSLPITRDVKLIAHWTSLDDIHQVTLSFSGAGVNWVFESGTIPSAIDSGTVLRFKVTLQSGFIGVPVIKANGEQIESTNGWYTITILEDTEFTVSGVSRENGNMFGSGTAQDPYMVTSANALVQISTLIENDARYATAYYRLGADINMTGQHFAAIGRTIENPFKGYFDGDGYAISNLNADFSIRSNGTLYAGLFGCTDGAEIKNLKLDNISYALDSRASDVTVYAGGVVGYANQTNFANISVKGEISPELVAENSAWIGGIAGLSAINQDGKAVAQNCFAKVTVAENDDIANLEEITSVGGIFGGINGAQGTDFGLQSIINCSSDCTLLGGESVGGIVGFAVGYNIALVNCFSSSTVKAGASAVSFAGGIVGRMSADTAIMDSVSVGDVYGKRGTDTEQESYAGGVVGYKHAASVDAFSSVGCVINSFYFGTLLQNGANIIDEDSNFKRNSVSEAFLFETLEWDRDIWTYADGVAVPTNVLASHKNYSLILMRDGAETGRIQKTASDGYDYVLSPQTSAVIGTKLFWAWYFVGKDGAAKVAARSYIPVVKDMLLDAAYYDISAILGAYVDASSAGNSVELHADGTADVYSGGARSRENYKFDGKHLLVIGQSGVNISATFADGFNSFSYIESISDEESVTRTYNRAELTLSGEFYSANGDIVILSGSNGISMFSFDIFGNRSFARGIYTSSEEGVIRLDVDATQAAVAASGGSFGRALTQYFTAMTVTDLHDGSVSVSCTGADDYGSLESVIFKKMDAVDYEEEPFLGKYTLLYFLGYSASLAQREYNIEFFGDGTVEYSSTNISENGVYRVLENGKILLEFGDSISFVEYIDDKDILFGRYNWGSNMDTNAVNTVMSRESEGALKAFFIDNSDRNVLYVTDNNMYYVFNGELVNEFTLDGDLRILQNGMELNVVFNNINYLAHIENYGDYIGYHLTNLSGAGSYVYNGTNIVLDAFGNVTGDKTGVFFKQDDGFIFIIFDDDSLLGFDIDEAKNNGNMITPKPHDGWQGYWYADSKSGVKKYYKIILDGFGRATLHYIGYDEGYRDVWMPWGTYSKNIAGVFLTIGNNTLQLQSLFDAQLLYVSELVTSPATYSELEQQFFYSKDYSGSLALPTPESVVYGSYIGSDSKGAQIELNLPSDMSGTLSGRPFRAYFDGLHNINFEINGRYYRFDISDSTLNYDAETVAMTRTGDATDAVATVFVGQWTGQLINEYENTLDVQIQISANGRISYGGADEAFVFDVDQMTAAVRLTVNGNSYDITLKWDEEMEIFLAEFHEGSTESTYKGELQKNA